jgi:hypothetical protein
LIHFISSQTAVSEGPGHHAGWPLRFYDIDVRAIRAVKMLVAASAAYLKFLATTSGEFDLGISNRKAALELIILLVPMIFRSS